MGRAPLEGIRVLDFTRAVAGTVGTLYLAYLGAQVIKVEAIQRPDMDTRWQGFADNDPGERYWERSATFQRHNLGKLGITLNLQDPKGLEVCKRLVRVCDIVAENHPPRVMESLGLDYDSLKQINPGIIMLSMSGYGPTGPRRDWKSVAIVMESFGLTALTGYPDGEGFTSSVGYGDWALGSAGTLGLVMALRYRNKTGKGQYIDASGQETIGVMLGEAVMEYTMNGRIRPRLGSRDLGMAPHNCYRCRPDERGADRWVAIAVRDDEEWAALCRVMGDPDWTKEERFADPLRRVDNQDELDRRIGEWTVRQEHREAALQLQQAGVPAAPVLNARDSLFDQQLRARGLFDIIDHPVVGKRIFAKQVPAWFSDSRVTAVAAAPMLGQHNRTVLQGILGLTDEEMADLEREKIIGDMPLRETGRRPLPADLDAQRRHGVEIDADYLQLLSGSFGERIGPQEGSVS